MTASKPAAMPAQARPAAPRSSRLARWRTPALLLVLAVLDLGLVGWLARSWVGDGGPRAAVAASTRAAEALITQSAEAFAQSGDVEAARQALAGYSSDDLARVFARLGARVPDAATAQRLTALRQALGVPLQAGEPADLLLAQPAFIASLAASVSLLLAALLFSLVPGFQRVAGWRSDRAETAEALAAAPTPVRSETPVAPVEKPASETVAAPQAAPSSPLLAAPAAQAGPETPPAIQEVLSSVFQEDASTGRYAVLLEGLNDISAIDLLKSCKAVARALRGQLQDPANTEDHRRADPKGRHVI